jgi:cytochrome c553
MNNADDDQLNAHEIGRRLGVAALILLVVAVAYGIRKHTESLPDPVLNTELQLGEMLATRGRHDLAACASCHGANGEGDFNNGLPRLAGLHRDYIAKQLADFSRDPLDVGVKIEPLARDYSKTPRIYKDLTVFSPGIRHDASMSPIARQLSDEDIRSLALYYSQLPFQHKPVSADYATLERGLDLALRGKPEYLVPRCNACHAPDGQGFGAHFPPLAGQPEQYIIEQISKWQRGERDNDHMAMMKNTANMLTDGDIINVARYFANLSYSVNIRKEK